MNNDSTRKDESKVPVKAINAEEFDAMFDAGEDVSAYIDWDKGVMVAPGELSPGQKLSIQRYAEDEGTEHTDVPTSAEKYSLSVSLPPWAFNRLQSEAAHQGISQEKLAQLLIVQRLDKEKVLS